MSWLALALVTLTIGFRVNSAVTPLLIRVPFFLMISLNKETPKYEGKKGTTEIPRGTTEIPSRVVWVV